MTLEHEALTAVPTTPKPYSDETPNEKRSRDISALRDSIEQKLNYPVGKAPSSPATGTGSSPPPSRCATASSIAGTAARDATYAKGASGSITCRWNS